MTTIAVDPRTGEMAGDTQINGGNVKAHGPKVVRLKDGSLFGAAGDCCQIRNLIAWLDRGSAGRKPQMNEVEAVILDPSWALWTISTKWPPILLNHEPYAIGTGDQAALAAMLHFGATPREAIKAAARVDPKTSAPITSLRLKPPKAP